MTASLDIVRGFFFKCNQNRSIIIGHTPHGAKKMATKQKKISEQIENMRKQPEKLQKNFGTWHPKDRAKSK